MPAKKPVDTKWNASNIAEMIKKDDHIRERGIRAIYARQTADEQQVRHTKHHNGIGFTAADAPFMSYCARMLAQGKMLSPQDIERSRNILPKYRRQLERIAADNLAMRAAQKAFDNSTVEDLALS